MNLLQKGEVVSGRQNGLIQAFFLGQIFKIKSLRIKHQLWGIPSSTLWNQYYKLQYDNILCEFEFCKLEIPSYKISMSHFMHNI